jgi:hypothetical protein
MPTLFNSSEKQKMVELAELFRTVCLAIIEIGPIERVAVVEISFTGYNEHIISNMPSFSESRVR